MTHDYQAIVQAIVQAKKWHPNWSTARDGIRSVENYLAGYFFGAGVTETLNQFHQDCEVKDE